VDGGSGADTLLGRAGKDRMDGRSGKDDINGGADNDHIKALDHERDTVNGAGGNRDVAFVDRRDRVVGVERINH
jgi:Ca2+-binding RTX toxin-like protein